MLLTKAIELFLENTKVQDLSIHTIENYRRYLARFNKYITAEYNRPIYIDEITVDCLEKYTFNDMPEGVYSSAARHNGLTAIKSFLSFCHRKNYCPVNVGRLVKNIRVETKEREYIAEVEFIKLTKALVNPTVKAITYTIFHAGLRIRECLDLKLEDVDLVNDIIRVKEGKGKKDRNIPINDRLKKTLIEYISNGRIDAGTCNFFSSKSGKICAQFVNRCLRAAAKKTGINKPVSSHIHRHSFGSNLIERGGHLLLVQKLLGHKSLRTTGIYLHTSLEELQDAVDLL